MQPSHWRKLKELVSYSLSTTYQSHIKNYCGKPGTRSESIVSFFSFLSTPKYEDKNGKLDFGDKDNKLDHLVTWLKLIGIK